MKLIPKFVWAVRVSHIVKRSVAFPLIIAALLLSSVQLFSQPCVTPPADLVSWWRAESLSASDSVGANNGIAVGGLIFGPGKVGQAFNLNGVNQYVNVGNSPTLNPSGSFTIEGWIYPRRDQANIIMAKWGEGGDYAGMRSYTFLMHPNRGLRFAVTDAANAGNAELHAFDTPNNVLITNAWNHVAAVYNRSAGMRQIFVNGVKMAERVDFPMAVNSTPVKATIGARLVSSTESSEWFDGLIDELSFYSRALTSNEIQSIFEASSAGKCLGTFPPSITAHPQDQNIGIGANANFSVAVAGTSPIRYQWKFNGLDLTGATNSNLILTNAQLVNAGTYRVVVSNQFGSVISSNASLTVNVVAPTIAIQPQNQTRQIGTTATFNVVANGTSPFTYQWVKNGINLADGAGTSGTSTASLTLSNIQAVAAGGYAVIVANSAGSVTSSVATLTITLPPTALQILSSTSSLGTVTVPIRIVAQGNENALGFSINFSPSLLQFESISLGGGISGGSLFYNTNQLASGRLGVALSLPTGATFASGTQQLALVTFSVSAVTNTTSTTVSFGDVPTVRQVSDSLANALPATYSSGSVTIPFLGFEADVAGRPNGDRKLTITDWVQVGRFVAGLDTITNSSEYQRADCAPKPTLGNGRLTVSDWVQAGRYAVGADPVTAAGGPTEEHGMGSRPANRDSNTQETSARELRVSNASVQSGQTIVLPVLLNSLGNENAIGFSLGFNPSILALKGVSLGSNAANATLNVNTNFAGKVGCVLALPIGTTFTASIQEIAKITFLVTGNSDTNVSFINSPVINEVSDVTASELSASYVDAMVVVTGPGTNPPTLAVRKSGANVVLSWPTSASGFLLEASDNLGVSTWNEVSSSTSTNGTEVQVTIPATTGQKFYRLRQP